MEQVQVWQSAKGGLVGVAPEEETARWIWNHHFSAVAGDAIAFEAIIMESEAVPKMVLHQYLLCHFGMSIGELWDLKALSQRCAQLKRWSFFLTSSPLNVEGGIGSPPNALAVF